MFTSLFDLTGSTITIPLMLACSATSLVLGFIIALVYKKEGKYTRNFLVTLTLLPVLVQMVIMMVNGNLGTSVAVLGTFGLVRFRSVPGSSKDICFIFMAMAIGLASGMGHIAFATVVAIVSSFVMMLLNTTHIYDIKDNVRSLTIMIPDNLDYTTIFDDTFEKHTTSSSLKKVKTTNLGSMFELKYDIILNDVNKEKELIDDIRCRNGNLTVVSARAQLTSDEL